MTASGSTTPRATSDVVVDGFTHGGEGVARLDGKAVFVAGALPGERITVEITEDRKRWARGRLVDVIEPAEGRTEPPCPYAHECGGCDLQHATPETQRDLKTRVVVEQLERIGRLVDPPVEGCRPVGPDDGYRTNAQLHADTDGRLGYYRAGSHDVVPVDRCLVLTPATQRVKDEIGNATGADVVAVRAHQTTQTAVAVLHPGPGPLAMPAGDVDVALAQPDGTTVPMRGDGVLREQVSGLTFEFGPSAFFQVNTGGAEAIVAEVLDAGGDVGGALVWDLYAGVGLLSLPLARAGAEVVAVEGHAAAAEWARTNAEANGLDVMVLTADVRDHVTGDHADPPDVVVLDPPRTGAGEDVAATLAALRPGTIVYVACDPAALARDAKVLEGAGYRLTKAVPLDLFPMTHHVEVVATFRSA